MRCKQCGKELPLFKKLADNDFCSAEHRELFVEAQHQLMLARLEESGRRMRSRLSLTAREPLVPPPPDPNPAPCPLRGFVEAMPGLADVRFQAWLHTEDLATAALLVYPDLAAGTQLHLAARVGIPGFDGRAGIRGIWGNARPVVFEPFVLPPRLDASVGRPGMGGRHKLFRLASVYPWDWRAQTRSISSGPLSAAGSRRTPALEAAAGALSARMASLLQVSSTSGSDAKLPPWIGGPSVAEFLAGVRYPHLSLVVDDLSVPRMSSRLYRFRPKNPVACAGLADYSAIPVREPMNFAGGTLMPVLVLEASGSELRFLRRPYRMRVGGPVACVTIAPWVVLACGSEAHFEFPVLPVLAVEVEAASGPRRVDRFFRSRPRSGVGWGDLFGPLETAAELFRPDAAIPGIPPSGMAPNLVERLFKARPRAGRDDAALPLFGTIPVQFIAKTGTSHVIPMLLCGPAGISAEPPLLTRAFRMRPRAGIADDQVASWVTLNAPVASCEPVPQISSLPTVVSDCRPAPLDRPFRMRPRAGIADDDVAAWVALKSPVAVCEATPQIASLPLVHSDCRPAPLDRPFRMRPRAGIACASIPQHQVVEPPAAAVFLAPAIANASFDRTACAPAVVERVYRMRPRAGIDDTQAMPWQALAAVSLGFVPAPTVPRHEHGMLCAQGAPVPPAIEKLFRMRPRKGVGEALFAAPEPLLGSMPFTPAPEAPHAETTALYAWPRFTPRELDKPFHMRPRTGINDVNARGEEPDTRGPITQATPRPGAYPNPGFLAAEGTLVVSERLFRMRPRGGVRGSLTAELSRPEALQYDGVGRSYPQFTGRGPALLIAEREEPAATAVARNNTALLENLTTAPLSTGPAAHRPASAASGCEPAIARDLLPTEPLVERHSELAPDQLLISSGPVEDSEIFVMPPVPELHVVHEYEMPRSDRQTRIGPPTAATGAPDLTDSSEPLDGALVARVMLNTGLTDGYTLFRQAMVIDPGIKHAPAWKRMWSSIETAFLGRGLRSNMSDWFHVPVVRLATCGAGVLFTVILWSASYVPVSSATGGVSTEVGSRPAPMLSAFTTKVKHEIAGRSATDLRDDFASGIHEWEGDGDWSSTWNYDEQGGVKPGGLAILKSSRSLTDYTFEFLGQIEQKALGFTFRSADTQNYQAVKLAIKTPGPLPVISIVHYAVVGGIESARQERRLPITVLNDTIYHVRVAVRDDTFTLAVNDQVVDAWVDNRIASGGVGFFAASGERARVFDVRVYHQADALGKALALIADKEPSGKGISQE